MATHTAAVLHKAGEQLQLETRPIPEAIPGSTVVKVLAAPISPMAKFILSGALGIPIRTPVTPSSSFIGRIHTVGPDATALIPGQLVFVDFYVQSRDNGDDSILQGYLTGNGTLEAVWQYGSYAEYAQVPLERVWTLDEDFLIGKLGYSFSDLSYLGSVMVALAGLLEIDTQPGDTVIIAPATGFFGGSAISAAIALGAKVIAVGRNGERLSKIAETFKSTGRLATVKLTGEKKTDTTAIRAATSGGMGADKYVDFSPHAAAQSTHPSSCFSALRFNGRAVLMGGIQEDISVPYSEMMRKNIHVQGRFMFERAHAERALKLLEAGHLVLGSGENSGIKVQEFKLQDIHRALDAAEQTSGFGEMVVLRP